MVNKLLSFFLCKSSVLKISFNINIKECGNTSDTHCSTVLSFDGCKISEVQPLESFSCIFGRFGDIISIRFSHNFHAFQSTDLISDLFTKLEVITSHTLTVACCEVFLFSFDQSVDSVQSHTSVVANDTSTSVSIRKTCKDLVVTCYFHLRCVDIKYTLVVSFKFIVVENIFNLVTYFISVSFTSLLCHFDTAVWHESTFQRFICLKTNNFFKVFCFFINISGTICCQRCNYLCLHIKNSAFSTFFFLKCLELAPQFVCSFCRSFQERSITVIWCIVHSNKVTYIDFFFPTVALKAIPLFEIFHSFTSFSKIFPRISHWPGVR